MAGSEINEPAAEAVREAVTEDAEALHALMGELADALGDRSPRFGAMRAQLEKLLAEPGARVLVVEGAEDLVGAASMWIKPDLAHGDVVIEVPMLVVSGDARRRGIGKLLVEEIQKIAAEENAALIELVATKENDVARAFYKSLGFIETDHIALEFVGDMQQPPDPKE
jgi:ribosomal protein S18 acetylase RimI-like enzyme